MFAKFGFSKKQSFMVGLLLCGAFFGLFCGTFFVKSFLAPNLNDWVYAGLAFAAVYTIYRSYLSPNGISTNYFNLIRDIMNDGFSKSIKRYGAEEKALLFVVSVPAAYTMFVVALAACVLVLGCINALFILMG